MNTHQLYDAVDGAVEPVTETLHAVVVFRVIIAEYVVLHGQLQLGQIVAHEPVTRGHSCQYSGTGTHQVTRGHTFEHTGIKVQW